MRKLTVVGVPISTCTRKVLMALEEKKVPYEMKLVDFHTMEHKTPEYLEKEHPFGQVPVLHDDDFKIFESRAIARYIDDTTPGYQLVPKDPKLKGLVEQWISIESSNFKPAETLVIELLFKKMFRGVAPDLAVVEEQTKKLHDFLKVMDKLIGDKNFLVGENFTLADLVFMPFTDYLLRIEQFSNVFDAYPNVDRWWKTICVRPAWQKVISIQ